MALTGYLDQDEKLLRAGLADVIEIYGAPLDFPVNHIFSRERYPKGYEKWEALALIENPDDAARKLLRLATVVTERSRFRAGEWSIRWTVKIGWGFQDERPADAITGLSRGNSYDELMSFCYGFMGYVIARPDLGVDDALTILGTEHVRTRFVPQDKQGNAAHVADLAIDGVINYKC